MKLQILLISGGCVALLAFAPLVHADPAKAEDDAYSMAVHYTQRGFAMSPTNTSGVATAGFVVKVMIPITKGLDYVILVGRDKFARDLDLYVYDEDGQLILDDRRTDSRAGVKFRASYTGTCEAFVHIARAQGLASYAVLVGRRGIESTPGAEPGTLGWEPTFQMGGSPSPFGTPKATPVASPIVPTIPLPSAIDRLLEKMQLGNIAFNAPTSLGYGKTTGIQLRLSAAKTPEQLAETIQEPGQKQKFTIKISDEMEARLTGEGFQITAIGSEKHAVSALGVTEWNWDIRPKKFGQQRLHLTIDAIVRINDHDVEYPLKTFDKIIRIEVVWPETARVFVQDYWQWICTTVLIPVIVWFGHRIWKGRQSRSDE